MGKISISSADSELNDPIRQFNLANYKPNRQSKLTNYNPIWQSKLPNYRKVEKELRFDYGKRLRKGREKSREKGREKPMSALVMS